MNKLLQVFEGITDEAIDDYLEENSTKKGIEAYAENGLNIYLSNNELNFLYNKIKEYKEYIKSGECNANNYFYRFENEILEYQNCENL